MGALTENRKRPNDVCTFSLAVPPPISSNSYSPDVPLSKEPRISQPPVPEKYISVQVSKSPVLKFRSLPPPQPLRRTLHAPQRRLKVFGSMDTVRKLASVVIRGNSQSRIDDWIRPKVIRVEASDSIRSANVVTVIDADCDRMTDVMTECLSVNEYKRLVKNTTAQDGDSMVLDWLSSDANLQEPKVQDSPLAPSSSAVSDLSALTQKVDNSAKNVDFVSVNHEVERRPVYQELYESSKRRNSKLSSLEFEVKLAEEKISTFKLNDLVEEEKEDVPDEPFVPLTDIEEDYVNGALFGSNRRELLVIHESSNIEITREVLQCLRPGGWLNDEVINLYLELLKEREKRNPKEFLKCHFFNTFFYKKLISGRGGYDFKAVRRWTTRRKIGYDLIECDKIFVPIHKEIHWCLAVINIKDKKFQYLDSLGGMDFHVLHILVRYLVDEVKDKSSKDMDTSAWKQEFVDGLPEQENGSDCGMFMIKYADFYSRDLTLCFNQDHMAYFRKRTAKEILCLRAE